MDSSIGHQRSLFEDCASACEAYHACGGGGHATAPCGCAWKPTDTARRYQCSSCYIVCRSRKSEHPISGHLDTFTAHVAAGLPLQRLHLSQKQSPHFPLLIPTKTADLGGLGIRLPLRWAAVDAKELLNWRQKGPATVRSAFTDALGVREHLNVEAACELIAVFNAQDKILESFWAMPRRAALQVVHDCAFVAATGPTFSISALTTAGTPLPRAHNVVMQLRQYRVLAEQQAAGLMAIPNLYWQDRREQQEWVAWLLANPTVSVISRDFTRTRSLREYTEKLDGLLTLLSAVDRPFHVLIVGAGPAHAPSTLFRLVEAGFTGSIITSDPIMKASHGRRYERTQYGRLTSTACLESSIVTLSIHNMRLLEDLLFDAIAGTSMANKATRNLLPVGFHEDLLVVPTSRHTSARAA